MRPGFAICGLNTPGQYFPIHCSYHQSPPSTYGGPPLWPIGFELIEFFGLIWRLRRVRVLVNLTDSFISPAEHCVIDETFEMGSISNYADPTFDRSGPQTEREILYFTGSTVQNDAFTTLRHQLVGSGLFFFQFAGLSEAQASSLYRTEAEVFYPQLSARFTNTDSGAAIADTFSVGGGLTSATCTVFGHSIPLYGTGGDPALVTGSVYIGPPDTDVYWEYRDSTGANPIYNKDTGAKLITPTPPGV